MKTPWPNDVANFEGFLRSVGLTCRRREESSASFGNRLLEYADDRVGVRVVSDRGIWFVEVADMLGQPQEWYDAAILRDLLLGAGDDVLTLSAQIEMVETNWSGINSCFGILNNAKTRSQLAILRRERAKRRGLL